MADLASKKSKLSATGAWIATGASSLLTPGLMYLAAASEKVTVLMTLPYFNVVVNAAWLLPFFILIVALFIEVFEIANYESLPKPYSVGFALAFNSASNVLGTMLLVKSWGLCMTAWLLVIWWFALMFYAGQMLAKTDWAKISGSFDKA